MTHNAPKAEILICDADPGSVAELSNQLEKSGYAVTARTASTQEALAVVRKKRPDAVLMDLSAASDPEGLEAARLMEENWGLPVIYTASPEDAARLAEVHPAYPFARLEKPCRDSALETAVQAVLYAARADDARRRSEEALLNCEAKYQQLYEHAPAGVYEVDFVGNRIVQVNDVVCGYLGYTREELLNMDPFNLLTKNSQNRFTKRLDKLSRGEPVSDRAIFEVVTKNGDIIHILINIGFLYKNKRVTGAFVVAYNITELRRTEMELRVSMEKYKTLFESFPLGVVITDKEGNIVEVNEESKRLLGLPEEEQTKRTITGEPWKIIRPDGSDMPPEEYASTIALKEDRLVENVELGLVKGDGQVVWLNVTAAPIALEDYGVAITFGDITDRKNIEDELKKNEMFLRKIFEILPVGLWVADSRGELMAGNPKGVEIWGAEPRVGPEEYRVFKARRLPSREEISPEDWALAHTINSGLTVENELIEIDAFDGRTKTVLNFTAPVKSDDGRTLGAVVVNQDVTELKRVERELRKNRDKYKALFENAIEAVFLLNLNDEIVDANQKACELLGYTREELTQMKVPDIIAPEALHGEENRVKSELEQYGANLFESVDLHKSGARIPVEVSLSLIHTEDEDIVFSLVRDISERKQSKEKIEKSLQEKELLLKELNHRVKNNMQVIIGLMNLQRRNLNDEHLKSVFRETQSRVHAMAAVHETLHQAENLNAIDLRQYISSLCQMTFQTHRSSPGDIKLTLDVAPMEVRLEQSYPIGLVVNELLTNALKYAFPDDRAGEIKVTGEPAGPDGLIKLTVADDGVGPPEVFDWENAETLGLHLAKALVERQLKGQIRFDSTSGGARWEIVFPK